MALAEKGLLSLALKLVPDLVEPSLLPAEYQPLDLARALGQMLSNAQT